MSNLLNNKFFNVQSQLVGISQLLIKEQSNSNRLQMKARLSSATTSMNEYQRTCNEYIETLSSEQEDEKKRIQTERNDLENQYYENIGLAGDFMEQVERTLENKPQVNIPTYVSPPELDTQPKLPTFDGTMDKWLDWKAYFMAGVHENKRYNAYRKMTKLKEALIGTAAEIIRDIPPTEEGYGQAWELLCEHYTNIRVIIKQHLNSLLNFKQIESPTEIKDMLIKVRRSLKGLEACGEVIEGWSTILVYVISERLDPITKREFEIEFPGKLNLPSWDQLSSFLDTRAAVAINSMTMVKPQQRSRFNSNQPVVKSSNISTSGMNEFNYKCYVCKEPHRVTYCPKYQSSTIEERKTYINDAKACTNCLNTNHTITNCRRNAYCSYCQLKHHSSLHENPPFKSPWYSATTAVVNLYNNRQTNLPTLLPSAEVKFNVGESTKIVRCLLDNCSQSHLISEKVVKKYRLPVENAKYPTQINGISGSYQSKKICKIKIQAKQGEYSAEVVALVIPNNVKYYIPKIKNTNLQQLCQYQLADSIYHSEFIQINGIDLLLGAEIYESILLDESKIIGDLRLRNTSLGWIVSNCNTTKSMINTVSPTTAMCVEIQLQKYWELDNIRNTTKTEEQIFCETHFKDNTCKEKETGKYIVCYPFIKDPTEVTNNYSIVRYITKRNMERLTPRIKQLYTEFLSEYQKLGHMTPIKEDHLESCHFIPHHPVLREKSTTTKLRVVFNASWTTKSGLSLNDCLGVGPLVQPELVNSLLRFRSYQIAFSGDIEKMYRCIWINPEDRRFQCIFGVDGKPYELNTITYGTASAPFLATRCLKDLADQFKTQFPQACEIIAGAYMDDLLGGGENELDVINYRDQVHKILESVGMPLRKYQSNSQAVLESIPSNLIEVKNKKTIGGEDSLAILGIIWAPEIDHLQLQTNFEVIPNKITKRFALSETAKLFDPLNLAAPVTVKSKLLMQKIWNAGYKWDNVLNEQLQQEFIFLIEELKSIETKTIPRYIGAIKEAELIGYCDASTTAYGAVVYLRWKKEDLIQTSLIMAKSRVAPIKNTLTIPKLELQAAVELCKLIRRVATEYSIPTEKIVLFSDSKITLDWILQPNKRWQEFVKNRVIAINEMIHMANWYYCPTKENPADLLTRGINAEQWKNSTLWFHGPQILSSNIKFEPINRTWRDSEGEISELLNSTSTNVATIVQENALVKWIYKFSNYRRLIRCVGYLFEFVERTKKKTISKYETRQRAMKAIIRIIQQEEYGIDIKRLQNQRSLQQKSPLLKYNPYLDDDGLLRSSTRIRHGPFSKARTHPMIIPANNPVIKALILHLHRTLAHASLTIIEEYIWNSYVTTGSLRNTIKKILYHCIQCIQQANQNSVQILGELPKERLQMKRAFFITGVDCAGPLMVKCTNHRSTKHLKYYLVLFICFSSRAVHLETVASLSVTDFLMALENFINRRGKPQLIYSDNGTNFKGTANRLIFDENFQEGVEEKGIQWKFNIPGTPHRGGLWESAIKSAKQRLMHIMQGQVLTAEQLYYTVVKVEAILNSRPLVYRTNVKSERDIITPGHLIIGDNLLSIPEVEMDQAPSLTRQYEHVLQRVRDFWSIWKTDYINQMAVRNKWKYPKANLVEGQLVLIKKYATNDFKWPIGIIVKLLPDATGKVRTVEVRLRGKVEVFAVQNLVPVPPDETSPIQGGENE